MGTGAKEMFVSYDTGSDVGLLPLNIPFLVACGRVEQVSEL